MTKSRQRILVTGGAGFIGSILVRLLLENSYKVTVLDSFLYEDKALSSVQKGLRIVRGDVRVSSVVREAMKGVNAVIHLAEIVGDPACDVDPVRSKSINFGGTKVVADIAKEYGIRTFVYASSCSVYGLTSNERLCSETDVFNPQSLYAELKIAAEHYLMSIACDAFAPTILRLSTIFGASFRPRFDLVVNTLSAKAAREGSIVIQGGGNWRPFIHVADVAQVILAVIERPSRNGPEVFNVGHDSQNFTILQVGELVQQLVPGTTLSVIEQASSDARSYRVDFSRLRETIPIRPQRTVADGIQELVKLVSMVNYTDPRYSNLLTARKISDRNGPKKVITMRSSAITERYRANMGNTGNFQAECPLCRISECKDFPHLRYWRIVQNQYPYDKVAEKSWILMSRRCVPDWQALTVEEQREYHEFRLIGGDYGVNFFMWSTPITQSVRAHYHEHMLRLHREP